MMDQASRYRDVRRVTLVGLVVNLGLSVIKLLGGWLAQSQALIADGIHSLSDLITDAVVLYGAKHAHREADAEHPYGHARIETLVTVGIGVALIAVGVGIGVDALRRLADPSELLHPGVWALVVALVSIGANEGLFRYSMVYARRLRSNMLRANAWHHRSDAISSVVVAVGVAGVMAGWPYLDAIAAVGVSVMIVKVGWDLSWQSLRELIDTGLDADELKQIRSIILGVDGVRNLHMLRTRRMAGTAIADLHIQVDPRLSVSEGHQIAGEVHSRLVSNVDVLQDVTVHIDPEDDEASAPCRGLPLRKDIMGRLREAWRGAAAAEEIRRVTLHYLDGKVEVDVYLPLSLLDARPAEKLQEELQRKADSVAELRRVRLYFE